MPCGAGEQDRERRDFRRANWRRRKDPWGVGADDRDPRLEPEPVRHQARGAQRQVGQDGVERSVLDRLQLLGLRAPGFDEHSRPWTITHQGRNHRGHDPEADHLAGPDAQHPLLRGLAAAELARCHLELLEDDCRVACQRPAGIRQLETLATPRSIDQQGPERALQPCDQLTHPRLRASDPRRGPPERTLTHNRHQGRQLSGLYPSQTGSSAQDSSASGVPTPMPSTPSMCPPHLVSPLPGPPARARQQLRFLPARHGGQPNKMRNRRLRSEHCPDVPADR